MPQYRCEYVNEICKEGPRKELLDALHLALVKGRLEDVTSWHITALGSDRFRWSGAQTIASVIVKDCRRDALRDFLFTVGLPEDIQPCDVVVSEVPAAVEIAIAESTVPVPGGIRIVPRQPDRVFSNAIQAREHPYDGLTEVGP